MSQTRNFDGGPLVSAELPPMEPCARCVQLGRRPPAYVSPRYTRPSGDRWLCTGCAHEIRRGAMNPTTLADVEGVDGVTRRADVEGIDGVTRRARAMISHAETGRTREQAGRAPRTTR